MCQVLGPTDPDEAPADSLRGQIAADWKGLGLSAAPNVGDNGVHASASPFEALAERMNWLGADLDSDPFGALLLSRGVPEDTIRKWTVDPQVVQPIYQSEKVFKGLDKGSLFDALEDMNREECLDKCDLHASFGLRVEGNNLPSGVTIRFVDLSMPAEEASVHEVVQKSKPWMELAADVVVGDPAGATFDGAAAISIPLTAGTASVKQVLHKIGEEMPWQAVDDSCVNQRDEFSCQVTVKELSRYYAVCKPVMKTEILHNGFLDKSDENSEGGWARKFFVAETHYLKFTNIPGDDPLGEFDLYECEIVPDQDDSKVFKIVDCDGKEVSLKAKDEAEAKQWMDTLQAMKDGKDTSFYVGSMDAQVKPAKEGYLEKKDNAGDDWAMQFFVAEAHRLKFTGKPGEAPLGEFDLREAATRQRARGILS